MSMFSRSAHSADKGLPDSRPLANSLPDVRTLSRGNGASPIPLNSGGAAPATPSPHSAPAPAAPPQQGRGHSVIGPDLLISGAGLRIVSNGTLFVDGKVQGDVQGSEVVVGESGSIEGVIAADRVIVKGKVAGEIRARDVVLDSTCQVEGDVHHNKLTIALGAQFEGRSRRATSDVTPTLAPVAA